MLLKVSMPSHRRSNLSQRSNSSRAQHAYRLRETRGQNIRRLRAQSARHAAVRSLETPDPIHSRLPAHSEIYSSTRRNTRTNNFFSSVWSSMENAGFNYSVAVEYFKHPLISLGMMDTTCRFCGALRCKDESSGMCCLNGKVRLPLIDLPPEPLRSLLSGENSDSVHFLRNIRKYNSCFQMTSFGAENQTHSVTFPTTFSIQGQVYHRIGSLMPSENQPSRFLRIYFMGNDDDDDDIQTDRRCQQIQGFKTALENLPSDAYRVVVNADRTPPGQHPRRYNAPTANEVAVVLAGNQFGSRDIVLHQRDNLLQHVSDTHRFYDALQYPLIFWKGQEGYSFHIPQIDPNTRQPLSSKIFIIPRIPIIPNDLPFKFRRLQFPVMVAFAMTINKSQGQTLQVVGVHLESPCFSHGQLYVACSRVSSPKKLFVFSSTFSKTRNIVYQGALIYRFCQF
ncbi:hypothetical protein LAZ67_13001346 [Cordylochernes scorpioides]|uniref:ATP-dependent DNA helicase n=1 Tax=Cordylochernes scorpioides TaxID=51811 RepID=A0ABY6L4K7_9ARAC|nr:hypothetical protein LAZ67_13001346 [Cordylochernes scorpioides]